MTLRLLVSRGEKSHVRLHGRDEAHQVLDETELGVGCQVREGEEARRTMGKEGAVCGSGELSLQDEP